MKSYANRFFANNEEFWRIYINTVILNTEKLKRKQSNIK